MENLQPAARALKRWMLILGIGGICVVMVSAGINLAFNHRVMTDALRAHGKPYDPQQAQAFLELLDTSVQAAQLTRWTTRVGLGALMFAGVCGIALMRTKRRAP